MSVERQISQQVNLGIIDEPGAQSFEHIPDERLRQKLVVMGDEINDLYFLGVNQEHCVGDVCIQIPGRQSNQEGNYHEFGWGYDLVQDSAQYSLVRDSVFSTYEKAAEAAGLSNPKLIREHNSYYAHRFDEGFAQYTLKDNLSEEEQSHLKSLCEQFEHKVVQGAYMNAKMKRGTQSGELDPMLVSCFKKILLEELREYYAQVEKDAIDSENLSALD